MRYWGKVAGVIIALLTGTGLWGVLTGLLLGHLFDNSRYRTRNPHTSTQARHTQQVRITFEVMGHIAKIKGRITNADITRATEMMQRMGLHGNARLAAQNAFRQGKSPHYPLRNKLHQFRQICSGRVDIITLFLQMQVEAAFANGPPRPTTRRLLWLISDELGISRHQFAQYLHARGGFQSNDQQYGYQYTDYQHHDHRYHDHQRHDHQHHQWHTSSGTDSLQAACQLLGVKLHSDAITIKRAYRKLMSEHHPDKLIAKGLSPARMQQAKQKAQKIQQAYNVIKLAKGFK